MAASVWPPHLRGDSNVKLPFWYPNKLNFATQHGWNHSGAPTRMSRWQETCFLSGISNKQTMKWPISIQRKDFPVETWCRSYKVAPCFVGCVGWVPRCVVARASDSQAIQSSYLLASRRPISSQNPTVVPEKFWRMHNKSHRSIQTYSFLPFTLLFSNTEPLTGSSADSWLRWATSLFLSAVEKGVGREEAQWIWSGPERIRNA